MKRLISRRAVIVFLGICMAVQFCTLKVKAHASENAASQMQEIMGGMQNQAETTEAISEEDSGPENGQASDTKMQPMNAMLQTTDKVNLRSGPDTDFESLGELEAEQTVLATGRTTDGTWYEIYVDGRKAYLSAEFAKEIQDNQALDAELAVNSQKAQQEIEAELQAQVREEQASIEAAKQEKKAVEEAEAIAKQADPKEKATVNWVLLLAGIFVGVFCISLVVILKTDQNKQKQGEQEKRLEIIDLEVSDNKEEMDERT